MFSKIVDGIFKAIDQLLPARDERLTAWVSKLITLFLLSAFVLSVLFATLRDTDLGRRYGVNTPDPPPMLTNREYRDISTVLYTYLVRLKEENPAVRAAFFVVVFDKQGNINFADRDPDRIGVFTWHLPYGQYLSFTTFEELLLREVQPYKKQINEKQCISAAIGKLAQERYKQAAPAFLSDRFALCPVPNRTTPRLPYGAVVVYWVDVPQDLSLTNSVMTSLKAAADSIAAYLESRHDLKLHETISDK